MFSFSVLISVVLDAFAFSYGSIKCVFADWNKPVAFTDKPESFDGGGSLSHTVSKRYTVLECN